MSVETDRRRTGGNEGRRKEATEEAGAESPSEEGLATRRTHSAGGPRGFNAKAKNRLAKNPDPVCDR
jgi:hypothetical protein